MTFKPNGPKPYRRPIPEMFLVKPLAWALMRAGAFQVFAPKGTKWRDVPVSPVTNTGVMEFPG